MRTTRSHETRVELPDYDKMRHLIRKARMVHTIISTMLIVSCVILAVMILRDNGHEWVWAAAAAIAVAAASFSGVFGRIFMAGVRSSIDGDELLRPQLEAMEALIDIVALSKADRGMNAKMRVSTVFTSHVKDEMKQRQYATMYLISGACIWTVLVLWLFPSLSLVPTAAFIVAAALLLANGLAFEYRISRGLYGTNEHEARRVVKFVMRTTEHVDFSGGLGATIPSPNRETVAHFDRMWGWSKA